MLQDVLTGSAIADFSSSLNPFTIDHMTIYHTSHVGRLVFEIITAIVGLGYL